MCQEIGKFAPGGTGVGKDGGKDAGRREGAFGGQGEWNRRQIRPRREAGLVEQTSAIS